MASYLSAAIPAGATTVEVDASPDMISQVKRVGCINHRVSFNPGVEKGIGPKFGSGHNG